VENSKNTLLNSGIGIAACTAFLYCVSTAYYGGFLSELHLDSEILDRNFHQVLYNGFLICFAQAFLVLATYAVTGFFYSYALLPIINDEIRRSRHRKRQFLKLKHQILGKRKDSKIEQKEKRKTINALVYVAIGLAFIFTLTYFEKKVN
jgi:hypothetical protein